MALQVITKKADAREIRIDAFAVGDRRGRGVCVFDMERGGSGAAIRLSAPEFGAGCQVVTERQELVVALGNFRTFSSEVEAFFGGLHFTGTHSGGEEDARTPHDGRRPATAGSFNFPGDILICGPTLRETGIIRDAEGAGAAKLRPGGFRIGGENRGATGEENQNGSDPVKMHCVTLATRERRARTKRVPNHAPAPPPQHPTLTMTASIFIALQSNAPLNSQRRGKNDRTVFNLCRRLKL